ncbi:B-box zinc finger protein [Pyxidicoccus sp. 3LFB2]
MAEMNFGGGAGALCPLHPEQTASRTCTRCGNFMCDTCSEFGSQAMCPTCHERAGMGARAFTLHRGNWSVGALLEVCWEAFKREWVMITIGVLIVIAGSIAGSIASQILSTIGGLADNLAITVLFFVIGYIVSTVVQGLVSIGFMRMLFDVLEGQRADLGRMFTQFHKVVPYLLTTLLIIALVVPFILLVLGGALGAGAITGGLSGLEGVDWTALGGDNADEEVARSFGALGPSLVVMILVAFGLYIFPGLWLMMPLLLVQPALARIENPTPVDTLRRCFAYARGERLSLVGVSLLGSAIAVAGFMACCVGILPAMGLFNLLLAGVYLALSNGAEEG